MSGGAFEYAQCYIENIANEIEEWIEQVTKPRPPIKTMHFAIVKKQVGENRFTHECWAYRCDTIAEAKHRLRTHITEEDGHIYDLYETWTDADGNEHRCEYIITEGKCEDWVDGYEDTCYYGPEYSEETLAEFRKGVDILRQAYIYAQRIDWLLSGDDGEDNFHERLQYDLAKLKQDKK